MSGSLPCFFSSIILAGTGQVIHMCPSLPQVGQWVIRFHFGFCFRKSSSLPPMFLGYVSNVSRFKVLSNIFLFFLYSLGDLDEIFGLYFCQC
jgi:hypothetical protein